MLRGLKQKRLENAIALNRFQHPISPYKIKTGEIQCQTWHHEDVQGNSIISPFRCFYMKHLNKTVQVPNKYLSKYIQHSVKINSLNVYSI